MRILISNDDGVMAPGIRALSYELAHIAEVRVVAPDRNRSGASSSLTLSRPLRVQAMDNDFYSVDGTPTDCVHLALAGILDDHYDMVVSGINDSANLGDDILYSGTVAAAMEGRNLGLPALAISMVSGSHDVRHYSTGAAVAKQLVLHLRKLSIPAKTIFNVNVPDMPLSELKGYKITRSGSHHPSEPAIKTIDPRGRTSYWIGASGLAADAGPDTDFYAVANGYVSITPLQIDMTHYSMFDQLNTLFTGSKHENLLLSL